MGFWCGVGEFFFEESEVESDRIERDSNILKEFSVENEDDNPRDEFVWSSLSFILEIQDQSPSKTNLKKRVRNKSSWKVHLLFQEDVGEPSKQQHKVQEIQQINFLFSLIFLKQLLWNL